MTDQIFLQDVTEGLSASPKYLHSKYFYDKEGSRLFQQIMKSPEYYLTNAEMQIFTEQSQNIWDKLQDNYGDKKINVIDLGAGDGIKTARFLQCGISNHWGIHYKPIDISESIFEDIQKNIPKEVVFQPIHAEYLDGLKKSLIPGESHLVLFLGSNIGNMTFEQATYFIKEISGLLSKGDCLLLGADLRKTPSIIVPAYNDKEGVTKAFNFNLLYRINRELNANFKPNQFEHFPNYNIETGEMRSYLISLQEQEVYIEKAKQSFYFKEWEYIHTEISKKFSFEELKMIGDAATLQIQDIFYDKKKYFAEVLFNKNE